ncbi:hypothetical protein D3C75_1063560 [compost metagenome]
MQDGIIIGIAVFPLPLGRIRYLQPLHAPDFLHLGLELAAFRLHQVIMDLLMDKAHTRKMVLVTDHIQGLHNTSRNPRLLPDFPKRGFLDGFTWLHFSFGKRNFSVPVLNQLNLLPSFEVPVHHSSGGYFLHAFIHPLTEDFKTCS